MFNDPREILKLIPENGRVLDIGGAGKVFPRANVVLDIIPYEQRQPGMLKDMPEQFTKHDWHTGDICAPAIWSRFRDKEFDFAVCSHVLEDIRDPLFVCSQIIRLAKAGYIEVPSRFRECAKPNASEWLAGWDHHRWIVDIERDVVVFTFKNPWVNRFDYLAGRHDLLAHYAYQFTALHWVGSFDYVERSQKGAPIETENLFHFYETYPYAKPTNLHTIKDVPHRGTTFLWVTDFQLPVERALSADEILQRHRSRLTLAENARSLGSSLLAPMVARWRGLRK